MNVVISIAAFGLFVLMVDLLTAPRPESHAGHVKPPQRPVLGS